MMDDEKRVEAVFGLYDGTVSVLGFVFGLVLHGAPPSTIVIGGIGGAIAAAVSMSTGEIEKSEGPLKRRLPVAFSMFLATMIGSLIPVVPFFFLSGAAAL